MIATLYEERDLKQAGLAFQAVDVDPLAGQPVVQQDLVALLGRVAERFPLCGAEWLRVIDGAPAARFLARIAQLIEDPMLLLTTEPGRE